MVSNRLPIEDRIKIGKKREADIIRLLKKERPSVCNTIWDKWEPSSKDEDMHDKIDAWATSGINTTDRRSAQIKYRETGGDLGIALVRPYDDFNAFKRGYINGQVSWDRDFLTTPDFYVCLSGNTLMVVEGVKVKKACELMLDKFVEVGELSSSNTFAWPNYQGAELKVVRDRGGGYSYGDGKIICYLAPSFINMAGGYVKRT